MRPQWYPQTTRSGDARRSSFRQIGESPEAFEVTLEGREERMLMIFTLVHVVISLVGIASGLVVLTGMLSAKRLDRWTAVFLVTTVATSVTGFMFPFTHFLPSHAVGLLSLVVLTPVLFARYRRDMAGMWRAVYVIGSVLALYLNVFVLVVQSFLKVPALKAMAPTQSEPPFQMTQLVVLAIFAALAVAAVIRFRVEKLHIVDRAQLRTEQLAP
jgi:hypothetical protein